MKAPVALALIFAVGVTLWVALPGRARTTVLTASSGPWVIRLEFHDVRVGSNRLQLHVTDTAGASAGRWEAVLRPEMPQMGHILPEVVTVLDGSGSGSVTLTLTAPGQWIVNVVLQGAQNLDEVRFPLLARG